jgi:succinyl-diaminopimelate desuccinylase
MNTVSQKYDLVEKESFDSLNELKDLTERLLAKASITPNDCGCQQLLLDQLHPLGFESEWVNDGDGDSKVTNFWAIKRSPHKGAKTLVFAGHTDVVPTGPLNQWSSDPFTPTYRDGYLFARGASDMKSSLAAMVTATQVFLRKTREANFNIAFLITSDEEGPATAGTVKVCELLKSRQESLDWCIVGEPTAVKKTGDMIKNGRRGSLSGRLVIKGVQGHIAYPQLAKNPVHLFAPALAELTKIQWDQGNAYFQPTTWQISNIHAGTGAGNVIASECTVDFNFRFSTESSVQSLQSRVQSVLDHHALEYDLKWTLGGIPFLTPEAELVQVVKVAIKEVCGIDTQLSTTGGTSDGRFISTICPQVIELGPPNATIHKINESIRIEDLHSLAQIYERVLHKLQAQTLA